VLILNTAILVLIIIFIVYTAFSYFFSNVVTKPKISDYLYTMDYAVENGDVSEKEISEYLKNEFFVDSPYGYKIHCSFFYNNSDKTVVCSHGITWSLAGSLKYLKIFKDLGFNVMIYDHRNHGLSGGKNTTFGYYEKNDLKTVVDWIYENTDSEIVGVHGESMGGGTVIQYSAIDKRIDFCIADCPFSDLKKLLKIRAKNDFFKGAGIFIDFSSFISFIKTGFFFSYSSPLKVIKNIDIPVLFVHGLEDRYIPCEMSIEMYREKPDKKDILLVENAKHAGSLYSDKKLYTEKLISFFKKYGILK